MKYEIHRICPASLGKIISAIYFSGGSIIAVLRLITPTGTYDVIQITGPFNFWASNLGNNILYLLIYPIILAVIGMALGFILAWIYNGISRFIGGIEITLKEKDGA